MESTPRTKNVTIDLTIDNSPAREKSELYKASVDLVRSGANIQAKSRTSDQSDCIAMEEPASVSSPRHRRRSVTFASPIEYVLDKKVMAKMQVDSSRSVACSFLAGKRSQHIDPPPVDAARSRRSPSPSKSNIFSTLRIPTGIVNMSCESPDQITPWATLQNPKSSQGNQLF